MALETIKVYTDQLQLGMYVSELDRPWIGSGFLFQGFQIRDKDELAKLRNKCDYVFVDREKTPNDLVDQVESERAANAIQRQAAASIVPTDHQRSLKQGVGVVGKVRERGREVMDNVLDRLEQGTAIEPEEAREVVKGISDSVAKNPDAAMWLTNLKKTSEDTAAHSMNVCALATQFARHLGYSAERIDMIGQGALLHDVGKIRTPKAILNKPGVLTPEEMKVMQQHAEQGHAVMRLMKGVSEGALQIIRNHHERLDGTGYPDKLKGHDIPEFVRVISICDTYDELISDRAYHKGMTAHQAITIMSRSAERQFGKDLMQEFIRCIGIYPVGSVVKLSDGSLGMVLSANPDARLKPIIMLLVDKDGKQIEEEKLINLAKMADEGDSIFIQDTVDPSEHGIDMDAIVRRQMGL